MNLLDIMKDQVTGSLVSQASQFLGESEDGIGKAVKGIFPLLLGKVISTSQETDGAQKLFDMASGMDNSLLDNIGGLFSGGAGNVAQLMNSGSGVLNLLLGNSTNGVIEKIAAFSGLKSSSTSSLLKMAAPFLMSGIGKQIKSQGLDVMGLASMLGDQQSFVKSSMPGNLLSSIGAGYLGGGFDSVLGLAGHVLGKGKDAVEGVSQIAGNTAEALGNTGKKVASNAADLAGDALDTAGEVAEGAVKTGGSLLKWLLPLFLLLLVASYFGFKTGCSAVDNTVDATKGGIETVGETAENVAEGAVDMAGDAANAVGNVLGAAFNTVDEAAKKALDGISFAAGSVGSQIVNFVDGGFKGDANFKFNELSFDSGSAKITESTRVEVDNLAAILKAYPKLDIEVTGYTDNTGEPEANVQLSKARAMAVKARLMNQGIASNRISTFGKGSENPVATNDTEEGRKQNRRIEVTIRK